MSETNQSWPGILYYSSVEKLVRCEDLIGKQFYCFHGESDKIVVSCQDGSYLVNLNHSIQLFWQESFLKVSAGKNFLIGIGVNHSLYSWGVDGDSGQLGQGASVKKVFEPLQIAYKANFQDISCGEGFSVALDDKGFAYAWGENFDRQLGIYSKTKEQMHLSNAVIEEVIFSPRLIPLSMKLPMKKVACGSRFVLALTQEGKLFSWGAGESGQLGTGRCTRRDLPAEVIFPRETALIVDISSGNGHALAVVENGSIYAWGLNHRGQCGVGDIKARHYPVKIDISSPRNASTINFRKVISEGHSSAAIDDQGRLWTWGSIAYGRLLHTLPPEPITNVDGLKDKIDMTIRQPKLVISDLLSNSTRVEEFVFTKERSAILVKTTVTDISPKKGPKRTFSKLSIFGYGFWESSSIIIKFTANNYSIYNPPRSCIGKFVSSTQLTCKPPKFGEIGIYTITVSMDGGKEFLPQSFEVLIYKDMHLFSQLPSIIDLREKYISTLTLKASALRVDVQDLDQVYVKLLFYAVNDANDAFNNNVITTERKKGASSSSEPKSVVAEIMVTGTLTPLESADGQATSRTEDSPPPGNDNAAPGIPRAPPADEVFLMIQCADIDLSTYPALTATNNLFELQCSISMNAQDFAVVKDTSKADKDKEKDTAAPTAGAAGLPNVAAGAAAAPTGTVAGDQSGGGSTTSMCHSFTPKIALPNYYSINSLFQLQEIVTKDQQDDQEKNINLNEYNPFNPEGNLILQQREEKYHSYDKKIILQGESFFLPTKLPKGSHIKVKTQQIRLIPLLDSNGAVLGSIPSDILTYSSEEIQQSLQELLVHCENKSQSFFVMNYRYLLELYSFLQDKQTNNIDNNSNNLLNYKIELEYSFYLEFAASHSSHYHLQQLQQQQQQSGDVTNKLASEKLLLSPNTISIILIKDTAIQLAPALVKKSLTPGGAAVAVTRTENSIPATPASTQKTLITILPSDLLGFAFQSSIFAANLQFPKLVLGENQSIDIPNYPLPKESIAFAPIIAKNKLSDDSLLPLAADYFTCFLQIPSYQELLQYIYRVISLSFNSSAATIASPNDLESYVKTITVGISYDQNIVAAAAAAGGGGMNSVIYYYNSLVPYTLQAPLPKGGAVSGTTISLVLEEYLPAAIANAAMSISVRIRGQDASKELILPATLTELTNATNGAQQTVVTFTIADAAKVIELGAVMNGKEKTFFIDLGLKVLNDENAAITFDVAPSPLLVMK